MGKNKESTISCDSNKICGCGGKTRTYDLRVMSIIFHGKEFAIARTTIGGAGTAGIAEELIAMGAKKY